MKKQALILFAHGARAASWAEPFERLQQLTQEQLPDVRVVLAFLELMTPQLPELLAEFSAKGITEVSIVPVFLGQGAHVKSDLPLLVEQARGQYPEMGIKTVEAVGEQPEVLGAIARYCVASL
ncbi:sirohydrochlorin cobaltochelatase [Glaciimonas immobilis]|uniref:Sirohydrochlorin cobaltochelatase n=2 Tax=Glaciimonas immobilis TaxID=728004 RepID=A0A840RVG7_9BURK|nr:cobalamin biosynthesis protein CbiX [Glaciimonas immobilis]MBB5200571.1 sirohydrochlorin cobaltochelatase [Glaciimonas immobilis]